MTESGAGRGYYQSFAHHQWRTINLAFIGRPIIKAALLNLMKVGLSLALVAFVFSKIDLDSAWGALKAIPLFSILTVLCLLLFQMLFAAIRLSAILKYLGYTYKVTESLKTIMIGVFFSQTFISFLGGDAMRVWRISRKNVPTSDATKSVVIDRLLGSTALVGVLLITIPFLVPRLGSPEMLFGLFLFCMVVSTFILGILIFRRQRNRLMPFTLLNQSQRFLELLLGIGRAQKQRYPIGLCSIFIHLLSILSLWVLARGLQIHIDMLDSFVLFPIVLFLSMIPISVAGWGVREGAMVAALNTASVPAYQSLALSIGFGLLLLIISTSGAILWMLERGQPNNPS